MASCRTSVGVVAGFAVAWCKRVRLGHLSPQHLEPLHLVPLGAVVVASGNDLRFTRDGQLESVRRFVANAVSSRQIDSATLHVISQGLQYEKLGLYKRLRQQVTVPQTPFEHVLFAAANPAGRCLDLVWSVFGIDPFGFRLSSSWSGPPFLCAIINPVLKGVGWSGPHFLTPIDDLLCGPTNRRSTPASISSDDQMEEVIAIISEQRGRAYNEAVDLVEMTCDQVITERFVESSTLVEESERSLSSMISKRLCGIYGRRGDESEFIAVRPITLKQDDVPKSER